MLPLGLISGHKMAAQGGFDFTVTIGDIIVKNMIPVSLGNLFAGAVCVAASYSFAFGKLGTTMCGSKDQFSCFSSKEGGGFDCLPKPAPEMVVKTSVSPTPSQQDVANQA